MQDTLQPGRGHRRRPLARRRNGAGRGGRTERRQSEDGIAIATSRAGRSSSSPAWASSPRSAPARTTTGRKLTAGESGIRTITRFPTDGLKTTIAGTVDFVADRAVLRRRRCPSGWRDIAAEEAIAQSGIGTKGDFPGPAVPRVAADRDRMAAALRAGRAHRGANDAIAYDDLLRAAARRTFRAISSSASCSARSPSIWPRHSAPRARRSRCRPPAPPARPRSSSASRRSAAAKPTPRCASAPTARSTPESLIRFSLLSALSTQNDHAASRARSRSPRTATAS